MSFTVGQRVCERFEEFCPYEDDRSFGKIISFNEATSKFKVQWESSWRASHPSELSAERLMTEEEANTLYDKLEGEFNAFANIIEDKMKEAGKLLVEASELADKNGHNLHELYDQVHPLMKAMREVGWSTSSLTC